jgi:23S rRNA pseudouridine1911/1915/1917 synthase
VAGDSVYGRPQELGLDRQFLHAARLAFTHPFTGVRVDVESPLPEDLQIAARMAAAS